MEDEFIKLYDGNMIFKKTYKFVCICYEVDILNLNHLILEFLVLMIFVVSR